MVVLSGRYYYHHHHHLYYYAFARCFYTFISVLSLRSDLILQPPEWEC